MNQLATITRFEDLDAWKLARELTRDIYDISKGQMFSRDFGLKDQICRSSVSVMSNIAEGFERDGQKEFVNFLSIAKGSAGEVRSQRYVALDQNYISQQEFNLIHDKCVRNSNVIGGLMKYMRQSNIKGLKFR